MQQLQAKELIVCFYRHWKWAKVVKRIMDIVGPLKRSVYPQMFQRQSGYRPPYPFHLRYVEGQPSWCCPAKQYEMFDKTQFDIYDYLQGEYLKSRGYCANADIEAVQSIARRKLAASTILFHWRRFIDARGEVVLKTSTPAITIQRCWRKYKISSGYYFKITSKIPGAPHAMRIYQYQDGRVWWVMDPYAPISLLQEQTWILPSDIENYIIRILVI
mgnify:CR=1 FL=1|jgi:hypothetical protein